MTEQTAEESWPYAPVSAYPEPKYCDSFTSKIEDAEAAAPGAMLGVKHKAELLAQLEKGGGGLATVKRRPAAGGGGTGGSDGAKPGSGGGGLGGSGGGGLAGGG